MARWSLVGWSYGQVVSRMGGLMARWSLVWVVLWPGGLSYGWSYGQVVSRRVVLWPGGLS